MIFGSSSVFQVHNFSLTATMTLRAAESRGEKWLDEFPKQVLTDHQGREADQVQIVVIDAWVGRNCFMNQAGPLVAVVLFYFVAWE